MNRADRQALEESQGVIGGSALGRTRSTRNRVGNNPESEGSRAGASTRSTRNREDTHPESRDETREGRIPIAIEVSDEDVSMRSHTTTESGSVLDGQATTEAPLGSEPLGHAETTRDTNPFPDTSTLGTDDEVDEFATDDGPSTRGIQPTNIRHVRGRQFYENFRCPQTGRYETARIEGSPPWKSFVLLTLPPFSRNLPRRGYACKKEQLGIRSSRFDDLPMLTARQLKDYIRENEVPGIYWICPYVDLDPLLDDDRVNNPQRNPYSWMKLDGPQPPFISRGVWNSVLKDEGQGLIDAHYEVVGQDPPIQPYHPSTRASLQADGARLRSQTPADVSSGSSGAGLAPRRPDQPVRSRQEPTPVQALQSQPRPTVERMQDRRHRTTAEMPPGQTLANSSRSQATLPAPAQPGRASGVRRQPDTSSLTVQSRPEPDAARFQSPQASRSPTADAPQPQQATTPSGNTVLERFLAIYSTIHSQNIAERCVTCVATMIHRRAGPLDQQPMATAVLPCGCGWCDNCIVNECVDRDTLVCRNIDHPAQNVDTRGNTFFLKRFNDLHNKVRIPVRVFRQHLLPWSPFNTLRSEWEASPLLRVEVEDRCTLCLEELGDIFQDCAITCDVQAPHIFHTKCLATYMRHQMRRANHEVCPLCRAPVTKVFTTGEWFKTEEWFKVDEQLGNDRIPYITWLQFNRWHPVEYPRITQSREEERAQEVAEETRLLNRGQEARQEHDLYSDQGKMDEAEAMYQRSLQGKERAWGPDHTSTLDMVNKDQWGRSIDGNEQSVAQAIPKLGQ
ncbi:beta transducin-like protein het-e4s [Apiospora arundinis]|uniref:Beta transducin-like protein het-e4s n=1 Tax=Apiospora arundinis TaxID=335852 RepID=A0ABR2IIJ5_9PEZI